ncbi:hypothetical protein BDV12DRAFT_178396 [Aspergillus spectabilis]
MASASESSKSRSGFSPSKTSLIESNASLRPKKLTNRRDFLFVDVQADVSQRVGVGRQKKVFLSENAHQRRKQASIERLKSSQYSLNSALQDDNQSQEVGKSKNSTQVQIRCDMGSLTTAYMSQGYVDPFCTYSVPMTDSMNMYLHHYKVHIVTSYYPPDATRIYSWWWQKAIASPVLLQYIISLAAGHKAALGSNQGVSSHTIQKSIQDHLRFRINAIKSLNNLLHNPVVAVAESTILLVSAIATIEALNADFKAVQAHMKGLEQLIYLMGGLDALNHITLSRIYRSDTMSAALQNLRPGFPMLAKFRCKVMQESKLFHRNDSNDAFEFPTTLASLGIRFVRAPWCTEINPSMTYLIKVFRQLIQHFEIAILLPNIFLPTDINLFIIIQHQLLSIHHTPGSDNLNEPLRLSLLIYLYLRVSSFQSFPIMRNMVETLRQSLAPRLSYLQVTAPDLLFWILFIGGMASQGYNSHPWFVLHLADMAHRLRLEEWVQVRPVVAEFFYIAKPGEKGAEGLWNEVLACSYGYIAPKPALSII